ncbi:INO80 complex subunit C [Clonorchis sinensis]|uniref:INO80 complex subunit C n=2 Tax=Clonorchis sinensis TaxID=79923 RepID=A0A8T1MTW3_CLOSI|nr:INO80 complex subunit C [Clonorchis sinensis]GAA33216.2 INO80 complex subunit C [Clonorchis sinensis]
MTRMEDLDTFLVLLLDVEFREHSVNLMATEFVFKTQTGKSSDKRMTYKTYKQILNAESQANYPPDAVLFHSIRAPPSLRPAMKVSDISGIPTAYTEPNTRLNYATVDEFNTIRYLPQEVVNSYLALRGIVTN